MKDYTQYQKLYQKDVISKNDKLFVLDLETTGLDYLYDRILEVAIYELNLENYAYKKVYDKVIRQDISQDFVKNCWVVEQGYITLEEIDQGIEPELAKKELQQLLECQDWTSYNVAFDGPFLKRQFQISLNIPKLCLMKNSTNIVRIPGYYDDFKWPRLQEAYHYFLGESGTPEKHRAGPDTQLAVEIAIALNKFQKHSLMIERALTETKLLIFNYIDNKKEKTINRKVRPTQFKRGKTQLEAFDYLRNEDRTFTVVRMSNMAIIEK